MIKVFSESYHQTHTTTIIRALRKPSDPVEGLNCGHINNLNKVKLNTGPVTYGILPDSLIIDVVPGTYGIFPHTVLLNIWFV